MKRFFIFFLFSILLMGCAGNQTSVKIDKQYSNISEKNSQKIKELKFKIAQLETEITEINKKIDQLNKKVDKLITPDSSMDEKTKDLILSKISELSAKQENYLVYLSNINKELSDIKKRLSKKKNLITTSSKVPIKNKKKNLKTSKETAFYQNCFQLYKNKNYKNSIKCFEKFISIYKKSTLLPNAYFWIGENYFKMGDFLKAIDYYDIVLTRFPKSKKIPSALLKEGMAFFYMKDKEGAKIFLNKVINEYPGTPQAYYAKRFIKKFNLK